ncbi:MAG: tetratricopeptide repeat protein [Deltaproteobacteria bacterium]|nr:tetratricopeptide repeat protein [Deltaproteobacteria bacterium]
MPKRIKPEKPLRESLASHHHQPEEEVRTYTQHLQAYVEGREVLIFSIVAAIVVLGGGFGIFYFLRANEASLAAERVSVAYADYRTILYGNPLVPGTTQPPWEPEMASEKAEVLARISSESEGTPAARLGDYLAGNAYLRAGEPEKAVPLLETAVSTLDRNPELQAFALQALGYGYEAAGKPEEAGKTFERLAAFQSSSFRVEGLLGTARALWAQGRKQEALETYRKARTEFPDAVGGPPGEMAPPLEIVTTDLQGATPAP